MHYQIEIAYNIRKIVETGYFSVQWSLYFRTLYIKTTLDYKTTRFGRKGQCSVLNDLYFKTTCNTCIRIDLEPKLCTCIVIVYQYIFTVKQLVTQLVVSKSIG